MLGKRIALSTVETFHSGNEFRLHDLRHFTLMPHFDAELERRDCDGNWRWGNTTYDGHDKSDNDGDVCDVVSFSFFSFTFYLVTFIYLYIF